MTAAGTRSRGWAPAVPDVTERCVQVEAADGVLLSGTLITPVRGQASVCVVWLPGFGLGPDYGPYLDIGRQLAAGGLPAGGAGLASAPTRSAGLWTTPMIPFTDSGELDHDGTRHNVEHLIATGVNGLGFGFSEPWYLSLRERMDAFTTFVEAVGGRVHTRSCAITRPPAGRPPAVGRHAHAAAAGMCKARHLMRCRVPERFRPTSRCVIC